ncbi:MULTISPECIES: diacylglycerol/lipid kinase family protein [Peribacillus]|uniref:diacylglycerol/lipid kinase family protein n=1 Tax=Peribacillus TaxID=2675229 RepID=UPI001F4DE7E2|nr:MULTISPECIES: diacylglycerol kinase family protein [unclassified Peribacillus]MCK1981677.1 diacylglycerol kinase family lipid kinase [Peribacillus sp. Aquil_B1]MCK2009601.1 diacylglycerol kinase family lipid kinase [Peribacillus sp. Aquil_B8]
MPHLNETVYFIVNPMAGNEESLKIWKKAEEILKSKAVPHEVFFTREKGHALRLTKKILSGTNQDTRVIAVGGDGTINEMINGAMGFPNAIIGSLAAGSGNDYVRGIQKTESMEEALSLFQDNAFNTIDIGQFETNGKVGYFVNSLGMGIDAEISDEANRSPLKKWFNFVRAGKLIYLFIFIKKLFSYKPSCMELIIDGKRHLLKKVWFIVIANQPYFGGGMKISPMSKVDDGRLNVIAVHDITLLKLLTVFITVLWGGHLNIKNVDSFSGKMIKMKNHGSVKIQSDGEIVGRDEVAAVVLKEKMRVMFKGDIPYKNMK